MLDNILLGSLAVLVGLAVTFYGYGVFRLLLPVVGFFFGYMLGKGIFADSQLWGFIFGILFAIALAVLSYAYWSVLMAIAGAFIGFSLGYMFGEWLVPNQEWLWVIFGIVLGAGFAVLYFMFKDLMVMVWTAFAGAGIIFYGLAVFWPAVFGWLENSNWLTFILTLVVGVIGTLAQMFIFSGATYYSDPPAGGPPYYAPPSSATTVP